MSISILELSTQVLYFYGQFPMVTRQSPAGSGRFGATFLQILMYKCALFQGRPVDNSFPGFICHHLFDPKLGEDRVLIPDDGTPALLLWLHVDDILLHGPTLSKVEEGLYFVLAEAQRLGLIYQPVKLMPPTQCLKFCGFLYDTHGVPTLLFELARHSLLLTSCNGTHTSVLLALPLVLWLVYFNLWFLLHQATLGPASSKAFMQTSFALKTLPSWGHGLIISLLLTFWPTLMAI